MDDDVTSCIRPPKVALKSQRLRNPFLLKIDPESLKVDNYNDGITLNIVCECSFWLFSFWATKIKDFHEKLSLDWLDIRNQLIDNRFMDNQIAYFANDPDLYQDEYSKIVHKVKAPNMMDPEFFNKKPRDRYPLAIILLLNDRELEEQLQSNDIVMLISIIHLKDTLVPVDTSIMAQYIKRKSGVILNLQDLYVSSDENESSDRMPYCVICLENHITRAFLPCRHACVCSVCLEHINTCPLCRAPIQNFILINQPVSVSNQQQQRDTSLTDQDEKDNHRNNGSFFNKVQKFFGF